MVKTIIDRYQSLRRFFNPRPNPLAVNLRRTFLLTITLIPILLSMGVFTYRQLILLPSYTATENQYIQGEINTVEANIEHALEHIDVINWDWASWDDTYDYMQTENPEYIKSNMVTGTFTDFEINIILLQDNSTNTVYGRYVELENETDISIPDEILGFSAFNKSGIITAGGQHYFISSRYILTSEEQGPAMGRMIMAKLIDESYLVELDQLTRLDPWIIETTVSEVEVTRYNVSLLEVHVPILDYRGDVAFNIGFTLERTLYRNGYQNSLLLIAFIVVFSIIIGVVSFFITDKLLLSRISGLANDLDEISKNYNISERLPPQGDDELGSLAGNINNMLESLEDASNQELIHKEELLKIREQYTIDLVEGTKDIAESLNTQIEKPLQALKNANYLLEKAYPEEKELTRLYHSATKSIEKILNEINYSLPSEEIVFRPFDISETIDKILDLQPTAQHRFERIYENKFHVINGDQNLIFKSIQLLLSKVAENCGPDKQVTIDIKDAEGVDIVFTCTNTSQIPGEPNDKRFLSEDDFEYIYLREVVQSHNGSLRFGDGLFAIHLPEK